MFGCIAIGILAAAHHSVRAMRPSPKLFSYSGASSEWSTWDRAPLDREPKNPHTHTAAFGINFLRVAGNFGGSLTVTGPAIGTSPPLSNSVMIQSSQGFEIAARAFGPITDASGPEPGAGSVQIEMALFVVGAGGKVLIAGPVQGTDAGFNGSRLIAPSTGGVVRTYELDILRKVNLTQLATGGVAYRSAGYLDLVLH